MNNTYKKLLTRFFHSEHQMHYSLDNIRSACAYFDNPQDQLQSIHIAGTNGKGSVSKMIFQILKESGKKVGVYTSPHNIDIRERFEMEDGLISELDFVSYVTRIMEYDGNLSYYERCTLLALLYFRDSGCEYAIIEVGMGGRLDATNIITPILSIITSISYDHMEFLGSTLEGIAGEKGGIIKPSIPVILYGKNPTLESIADDRGSPIIYPEKRQVRTNLLGEHQISNARIAYEAAVFLSIPAQVIESALREVDHPGRLQYLRPNLLIDGAHNEDGMRQLRSYLKGEKGNWKNIVYSFNLKAGKSAHLVLDIFPEIDSWNIVDSIGFCVCDAQGVADAVRQIGKNTTILTPADIFVQSESNPKTLFVVFGSLYMLKEFLEQKNNKLKNENQNIKFPFWYMDIKYNSKIIPDGKKHDIQLSGANCQVYAYEILRYNGLLVPDLRSSELWTCPNCSRIISCDYELLDILFFNETNDSWGAHLGVYIGDNKILHNSKDIGNPEIIDIGDFTKIKKYSCLLGGKRFKKL